MGKLWRPVATTTLVEPILFVQLSWLLGGDDPWSSNLVAATLGVATGLSLLWLGLWHTRLRSSDRATSSDNLGRTTLLAALERPVFWGLGLGLAWLAAPHDADSPTTLVAMTGLTVALSSVSLRLWADHELTRTRPELRRRKEYQVRRFVASAVLLAILGILAVAVFDEHLITMGARGAIMPHVLGVALVTGAIWMTAIRQVSRRALSKPLPESFKRLQGLPYITSTILLVLWILGGLVTAGELTLVVGMDSETSWLLFLSALVAAPPVFLATALWHRRILRPVLEDVTSSGPGDLVHLVSPLSLRTKMLIGFGGLLVFASAAAFLWGYVQYRNLARRFLEQQAILQTDLIIEKLRSRDRLRGKVSDSEITGLIQQASRGSDGSFYFLTKTGELFSFTARSQAPQLPFPARTKIRSEAEGTLSLPEQSMAGAFKRIDLSDGARGTLAVLYPDHRGASSRLSRQFKLLTIFFVVIFAVGAIIVYFLVQDIASPIKALQLRTEEMARGDIHRPVPTGLELDELGRLALSFERMRINLDDKLRTIQKLNVELEKKVADRTADLAKTNRELSDALEKLTATKDQLVRSEKLASIGQLVAGLAHELNNPTNALVNSLDPLEASVQDILSKIPRGDETTAEVIEDLRAILKVIRHSTKRTKRIVTALGSYSHPDAGPPAPVDVNAALEDALSIVSSLFGGIHLEKNYGDAVVVTGWRGQLEQVFVNLLANAAQALEETNDGFVGIRTARKDDQVEIVVEDNGPGVAEDLKNKIFDPFFTTKEVGKGTGLGLSICQDIVLRHGGSITVKQSELGGAKFVVTIPIQTEVAG